MANHAFPRSAPVFVSQMMPAGFHAITPPARTESGPIALQQTVTATLPSPFPPSAFGLEPARDADAALYRDARIGFSHLVPGRPTLVPARLGDRTADTIVQVQDAPITIRYKLEPQGTHVTSGAELARMTAERFAAWRAQSAVRVDFANPSWLLAWGADAAAIASYDVAPGHGLNRAHEDLFVLCRQGATLIVTWTYPKELVDDPAYAAFASVAEATMIWDPTRWDQRGRIWPESPFVGPGIRPSTMPQYAETARCLEEIPLAEPERARALGVLAGIASNIGAPWVELDAEVVERSRAALVTVFRSPELQTLLMNAFAHVRTAHDLRGLAVVFGRALDRGAGGPRA